MDLSLPIRRMDVSLQEKRPLSGNSTEWLGPSVWEMVSVPPTKPREEANFC